MNLNHILKKLRRAMLALLATLVVAGPSYAVTFNLKADKATVTYVGTPVNIWGFGMDPGGPVTAPGPVLEVPVNDTTLTINLQNNLLVPVSIIIPGLQNTLAPVRFGSDNRVRSFVNETLPQSSGSYTWNNVKPGTYLYQSGTHPQVQIPMGLYGAVKADEAVDVAYPGISYDNEAILLYSEIDPTLHEAVDPVSGSPTYGTPAYMSTTHQKQEYFLVNGKPFSGDRQNPGAAPVMDHTIQKGETVLIRFLNAGINTYVPQLLGPYMSVVAENGYKYTYPKETYSVMLGAGKTTDALWTANSSGLHPVYDRKLHLTNAGQMGGGMLAYLKVGDTVRIIRTHYKNSLQRLKVWAVSDEQGDTPKPVLTLDGYGTMTFKTNNKGHQFYIITKNGVVSKPANVTVDSDRGGSDTKNVSRIAAPRAADDAFTVAKNGTLNVSAPGIVANDDIGGRVGLIHEAVLDSGPSNQDTFVFNADGSFDYTPALDFNGSDSFTYHYSDGKSKPNSDSNIATVDITVTP